MRVIAAIYLGPLLALAAPLVIALWRAYRASDRESET